MIRVALTGILFALAAGAMGCGTPVSTSALPTTPTPIPTPVPSGPSGVALFGTISERTVDGQTPIAGVLVYCDACGEVGHTFLATDANGSYRFSGDLANGGGVWLNGPVQLLIQKEGYTLPNGQPLNSPSYPDAFLTTVTMRGDTQFDIVLVRR